MDEMIPNRVILCGVPCTPGVFSHAYRSCRYYRFYLETARLSGTMDRIPVVLREAQLPALEALRGGRLEVRGELRSYNNRSGEGPRLVITVFARELTSPTEDRWENRVELTGTLCREPVHRTTPLGREITDLMLAVRRPYGRSDYLPCIAWGSLSRAAACWGVGTQVRLTGRFQSREYTKWTGSQTLQRTAYEVSAAELFALGERV